MAPPQMPPVLNVSMQKVLLLCIYITFNQLGTATKPQVFHDGELIMLYVEYSDHISNT